MLRSGHIAGLALKARGAEDQLRVVMMVHYQYRKTFPSRIVRERRLGD
jgi:hypothetical protein